MKKIYFPIMLGIVAIISGCHNKNDELNKQLLTMINQNNATLPKMIDDKTRLDRIEKINNQLGINYIYTIVHLSNEQADLNDYQQLKPTLVYAICNQTQFAFFVQNNIIMRYSYFTNEGKPAFTVTVQPSLDCLR